ncbi:MAG: MBL fold metallo-hydrolase [Promethearchaeota archaeon]
MIDNFLFASERLGATYLLKAGKSCLIDGGTREGSKIMIETLENLNAFPPDYIILTHSHFDHTQGVPAFRELAKLKGKEINVFASQNAIPNLQDQSFNKFFQPDEELLNIQDVKPLKEGDIVDLDGLILRILEVPGHTNDQIAVFDEKHKVLFPGDSIGLHIPPFLYFPHIMPPFYDKEAHYNSMEKMKQLNFQTIAIAHYGCIEGKEAQEYIPKLQIETEKWWLALEIAQRENRLEDIRFVMDTISQETKLQKEIIERISLSYFQWTVLGFRSATY